MLGDRGRADPQDRGQDRRHHAGDPRQDGGLRLPGRSGTGARRGPAPCPGGVPVLPRRQAHGGPGQGRAGRGRPPRRDPRAAAGLGHGRPGQRHRGAGPVIRRYLGLVVVVAALALTLAWLGGWPPRRLYLAALACLPMVAVWLAAVAVTSGSAARAAAAPYQAWLAASHQLAAGSAALAVTTIAPAAIPLGLAVGGLAWSRRIYAMETGTGGIFPTSPAAARYPCSPGAGPSWRVR